jgi:hypothetical protein
VTDDVYSGGGASITSANNCTGHDYQTLYGRLASTTHNVYGVYDMAAGAWEYVMTVYTDASGTPMSGRSSSPNSGFVVASLSAPTTVSTGICKSGTTTGWCSVSGAITFPDYTAATGGTTMGTSAKSKYWEVIDRRIFVDYDDNTDTGYKNYNYCTFASCGGKALFEVVSVQVLDGMAQAWNQDFSAIGSVYRPWLFLGGYAKDHGVSGLWAMARFEGGGGWDMGWRAVMSGY